VLYTYCIVCDGAWYFVGTWSSGEKKIQTVFIAL